MKRKKILIIYIVMVASLVGTWQYVSGSNKELEETYKNLEVFSSVLSIVQQDYEYT